MTEAKASSNGQKSIRDLVRAADDERKEIVDVPEWGVKLEVRSVSARERVETLGVAISEDDSILSAQAAVDLALVIAATFDPETGDPVFQPSDVDWLADKNAGLIVRLSRRIQELSGLGPEAMTEAGKASLAREAVRSGSSST